MAAVLRERRRPRLFGARRWAVAGAMAAVFVGGAAWGLGGLSFHAPAPPASPPTATIETPPAPAPRVAHAPPTIEAAPPPAPRVMHAPLPAPSVSAPTMPRRKAEPARRVFQPRCFCSPKEAICDCF